ncbi:MAG TPA: outer membrane beta-barrel protein [Chitinophagaceae bacterium]|nr:outer membrane beta-barrel protein [Chitinophagaceae bacterium]
MLKKAFFSILIGVCFLTAYSQDKTESGVLAGNVMDSKKKALEGATVQLVPFSDNGIKKSTQTDKTGDFQFTEIPFGYYKLIISHTGLQTLTLDSIWFRTERYDFNLTDITLQPSTAENLEAVIVYAEKPLIQSKDGNITFNAGESALAAGSNASELLNSVPLVTKDADGKITVRGKEPKILIDDKPVELNLQQLQDLLESLPGSSIEKIEVMTNPPPQYANEQGGIINIVTKKGKVGVSGRLSVTAGTRGQLSYNGSFTYRKQGLAININAGAGHNRFAGNGYSIRNNFYTDSSNFFNTVNNYTNKNFRPNFRMNIDYDINKNNLLNFTLNYNQNSYDNNNLTEYRNINRFDELWKLSQRNVHSVGDNYSPTISMSYTWKGKPGETLKIISGANFSFNSSDRDFYQVFLNPDYSLTGQDSTQEQLNDTKINGYNGRISYDKMLDNKKTFISVGSAYSRSNNHVTVDASYKKKPEGTMENLDALSNDFWFHQTVANFRASMKQIVATNFSFTVGTSIEKTNIWFELLKESKDVKNNYWTWLPFANINKSWKDKLNLTLAYRRTIRRPGINELNPTIDFSDPYNVRFGNEKLEASTVHNFDFVAGRTGTKYFLNLGVGYNIVQDVFSQVRTLLPDGKTQVTWENISGRKEYEISTWNGITMSKKLKLNANATYVYSRYSEFDKSVRKFRDGGSFTSNINSTYTIRDVWNITGSFNLNRFGNPQGFSRWSTSMNVGVQKKFFDKRLTVTVNVIDPFVNQQRRVFTYGANFNHESYSETVTRNFRLSVAYSLVKKSKKQVPSNMIKPS